MPRKPRIPAEMPANAAGFIAIRPRNEHPAFFNRDGELQCTFAYLAPTSEIAAILANGGLRLDGQWVFRS
jgi:hypothetical protein